MSGAKGSGLCATLSGEAGREFAHGVLPDYLPAQRWFGAKESRIDGVDLTCIGEMPDGRAALCVAEVALPDGPQRYFLPLTTGSEANARDIVGTLPDGTALCDGVADMTLAGELLQAMRDGAARGGLRFEGEGLPQAGETGAPRLLAAEQSNVSIAFGSDVILKIYRRLRPGAQPDVEISRHLTRAVRFAHVPSWLGSATLHEKGAEPTTLAAAFAYVANRGDAWSYFAERLDPWVTGEAEMDMTGQQALCRLLGKRTGGLHRALAADTDDPAFAAVAITERDLAVWVDEVTADLDDALRMAARAAEAPGPVADLARDLVAQEAALKARLAHVRALSPSGRRTRIHGDYHLGQVLVTTEDDFAIIDFEGEPRRDLAARRALMSPLRDVAGMLRSLDYAARAAVLRAAETGADTAVAARRADDWHGAAARAFMTGYRDEMAGCAASPDGPLAAALLDLFLVQKAAYEVGYELSNRPTWAIVPMAGLLKLADAGGVS